MLRMALSHLSVPFPSPTLTGTVIAKNLAKLKGGFNVQPISSTHTFRNHFDLSSYFG